MAKQTKHIIKGREFTFEEPVTRAKAIKVHGFNKVKRLKPKVHFECNIVHANVKEPVPFKVQVQDTQPDNIKYILDVRKRHPNG